MEHVRETKKKAGKPATLKEKKKQAIAGSRKIAADRDKLRRLMGLDV